MQAFSRKAKRSGKRIALVPTMGYLHEGHLSLIDIARKSADVVVVSIFVNPTQFSPSEDLAAYPRDLKRDSELCEARGVDAVYTPEPREMYAPDASTWVVEESLSVGLCGRSRPTHFRGVTTVVAKLFNAALPDLAVFGQKDAQQVMVIKRMTRDLDFPVEIIVAPIIREPDGLAMSSRNVYLSQEERRRALSISRSLKEVAGLAQTGEESAARLADVVASRIKEAEGQVDYVEIVDAGSFQPVEKIKGHALVAVAARFGKTRLIDNTIIPAQNT